MKLIEDRDCGECTVCCEALKIEELSKPEGELCKHCEKGKGCTVYQSRPDVCKQWFCMWRWFPFAKNVRPDKSGILLSYEKHPATKKQVIVVRDVSKRGNAFDKPGFDQIMQSMVLQGLEVWVGKDGVMKKLTLNDV